MKKENMCINNPIKEEVYNISDNGVKVISIFFMAICHILRSTDLFFRVDVLYLFPVSVIIFWEHFFNFIILLPVLLWYKSYIKFINLKDILLFCLIGFGASASGILCFTTAFKYMNPALVILLQKLQPLVTFSLGAIILSERFKLKFYVYACIAIVASYFATFSIINPFSGEGIKIFIGTIFALMAVLFWGSGTVWGKILLKKFPQPFVLASRFFLGLIFASIVAYYVNNNLHAKSVLDPSTKLFWKMLYMSLVPGLFATGFFYLGLIRMPASLASVLELIFPISSVLIMWLFFNKPLDLIQIIASVIMLYSITYISINIERLKEK